MASSAFKSTTKRTPIGRASAVDDSSSSNRNSAHRRSRSLSRFSRRLSVVEPVDDCEDTAPSPRGRFVNTVRGSGFPEISLDDLAVVFLGSGDRSRKSDGSPDSTLASSISQRRSRSVSRHGSSIGDGKACSSSGSSGGGKAVSVSNSRRRRSLSVVPCQIDDSESDIYQSQSFSGSDGHKSFSNRSSRISSSQKSYVSNTPRAPRRSLSQKDFSKLHDGYSSHSSALTDDDTRDERSSIYGTERIIRAVNGQKAEHSNRDDGGGELYDAMRKEFRHAVEEIKTELEQAMLKTNSSALPSGNCLRAKESDVLHAVSTIKRNYTTKLEQTEKQKLLDEIISKEQGNKELSKMGKEMLPDPRDKALVEKPLHARKRSNDRNRLSKQLTAEAEKYFEDFISNVEDTDISSFDGERSDSSSTLGGMARRREPVAHGERETCQTPAKSSALPPIDIDGVRLPWLQWETKNDFSPLSCNNKTEAPVTPETKLLDASQDRNTCQDQSNYSKSSHGSWSPGVIDEASIYKGKNAGEKYRVPQAYQKPSLSDGYRRSVYDQEEYLKLQKGEDFLLERLRQQQRINMGGILLCDHVFL